MAKSRNVAAPNPADPPLVLTAPERENWTAETDVVVVGFGGAGACAALEAKAQGARVLVLDRFHGGGATAISGGVFYSGGGTHIQNEAGVQDDAEQMFRYLSMEVQDVVSPALLRDFCERSADNLRWLERHGVPFEASLCPVKTSFPNRNGDCLGYDLRLVWIHGGGTSTTSWGASMSLFAAALAVTARQNLHLHRKSHIR